MPQEEYYIVLNRNNPGKPVDKLIHRLPKNRVCLSCKKKFEAPMEEYVIHCPECLKNKLLCGNCNSILDKKFAVEIDKQFLCKFCFDVLYFKCANCKKVVLVTLRSKIVAHICAKCEIYYKECKRCKGLFHDNSISLYKDEFETTGIEVCKKCISYMKTYVPQNISINEDLNSIKKRIFKKKIPTTEKSFGDMSYNEKDSYLGEMIKWFEDNNIIPKKDIYFFGLASGEYKIKINRDITQYQLSIAGRDSVYIECSGNTGPINVGISMGLREIRKWDTIYSILREFFRNRK